MLAVAPRIGYSIAGIGVTWREYHDSQVAPVSDSFKMLLSLTVMQWYVCKFKLVTSLADNAA